MFIDTLHPVHEGRLFRWGYGPTEVASARIRPHQPGRARCVRLRSPGCRGGRALAAQPVLQDAANRRVGSAPPPERRDRGRILGVVRLAGSGDDRLRRDHHPLCRRRRHRRDGWRVLVMGNKGARRIQRRPDRRAAADRAVPRARHQIGIARAHDRNADGNLSRSRRRPARAQRPDRARNCRAHRCRYLVQRLARVHAHHRHCAGTGHPIAERLLRRNRLGHSRAWR